MSKFFDINIGVELCSICEIEMISIFCDVGRR